MAEVGEDPHPPARVSGGRRLGEGRRDQRVAPAVQQQDRTPRPGHEVAVGAGVSGEGVDGSGGLHEGPHEVRVVQALPEQGGVLGHHVLADGGGIPGEDPEGQADLALGRDAGEALADQELPEAGDPVEPEGEGRQGGGVGPPGGREHRAGQHQAADGVGLQGSLEDRKGAAHGVAGEHDGGCSHLLQEPRQHRPQGRQAGAAPRQGARPEARQVGDQDPPVAGEARGDEAPVEVGPAEAVEEDQRAPLGSRVLQVVDGPLQVHGAGGGDGGFHAPQPTRPPPSASRGCCLAPAGGVPPGPRWPGRPRPRSPPPGPGPGRCPRRPRPRRGRGSRSPSPA